MAGEDFRPDYHKMGRRELIENAKQGAFDVASAWGSITKAIPKRNKKTAH
jgi:hypothetical protein